MSKTDKQLTGDRGEEEVATFLMKRGYQVFTRNYRKKWGELDVVAGKDGVIHFVEVKTVVARGSVATDGDSFEPEDNMHPWKLKRLSRAIQTYLLDNKLDEDADWQLDVASVYLDPSGKLIKIEWLEDVF